MGNPEITTIIPTFNRSHLLKRAVASVQAQNYDNLKICIYDNASGDETEEIVAELMKQDSRIYYVRRETNIGAINSMIDASMRVTSTLYSILNDDDLLLPGFLTAAVEALERFPRAGIACARTVVIDVEKKKWRLLNRGWKPGYYEPTVENVAKMRASHFCQTGVMIRTGIRDAVGPFERSGDDNLQQTLIAASFPFVVLDCVGAALTLHAATYSSTFGLRRGDQDEVLTALVSTSERILQLDISTALKGYLMLLVCSAYGDSFRRRKLEAFFGAGAQSLGREEKLIPNVSWKRAGALWLLESLPGFLQQMVIKVVRSFFCKKQSRTGIWNNLSKEIVCRLDEDEGVHLEIARMVAED